MLVALCLRQSRFVNVSPAARLALYDCDYPTNDRGFIVQGFSDWSRLARITAAERLATACAVVCTFAAMMNDAVFFRPAALAVVSERNGGELNHRSSKETKKPP